MAHRSWVWGATAVAISGIIGWAQLARADFMFSPAFSYSEKKDEYSFGGSTASSKVRTTNIDVRLGYVLSNGVYIGGLYNTETVDWGGGIDEKGTGTAGSVGYLNGGFTLIGSYFFMAERETNSGGTKIKYKNGSGMQIDIAYLIAATSSFYLGPQITWRALSYDKREVAGIEQTGERKVTEIRPMIALAFRF